MSAAVDCDAVIVGAGLVGAAIALGLHRAGLRVRLVDRGLPLPPPPDEYDLRVVALSPASTQFLQQLGVWDAVRADRTSPYTRMQVWETTPQAALHFDATDLRLPQLGHIVENAALQRALLAALPNGVFQDGLSVRDSSADETLSVVQFERGPSLRTRVVIAADSAQSPLRHARGIGVVERAYDHRAIVCHVRTQWPHQACAYQRFLDTGPVALLPLADGRSSVVWSSRTAAALLAMDDATFCTALGDATQQILGRVLETSARRSFALRVQNAQHYVDRRLVLAGDAAHVVHPLAGQGVNLGFGDAQCLIDVLSAAQQARRDLGSARVLARYQRARRVAAQDMIAVTDGLYHAYAQQAPAWAWLRREGLTAVNAIGPLRRALIRRASGLV